MCAAREAPGLHVTERAGERRARVLARIGAGAPGGPRHPLHMGHSQPRKRGRATARRPPCFLLPSGRDDAQARPDPAPTWTFTRSPLGIRTARASRTLSAAAGPDLGRGAEEQERRARSRQRAPNMTRARPAGTLPARSPVEVATVFQGGSSERDAETGSPGAGARPKPRRSQRKRVPRASPRRRNVTARRRGIPG